MKQSSRVIRVFLSSTFVDLAEEREKLVREVFPKLRQLCRERHVELVDVDLRWGITKEESESGKTLPICLDEVDRARPYFIGILGERYGWVPAKHQYPADVVEREPWLTEHQGGKSVTELEMLHGVLNNQKMDGRAFFYFRDPSYSSDQEPGFVAPAQDKARLDALKDRIRSRGEYPVYENYANPQALADRVHDDLLQLIDEEYPVDDVPDALTLEAMQHEAYSQARRRYYFGGKRAALS